MTAKRDSFLADIRALKVRLQADSKIPNLPPSQDKPWKPQSERVKANRSSGAQPGHVGKALEMSPQPDEVIILPVTGHCGCGQT